MEDFDGGGVLVAGGAGFIGSSVVRMLLARNARVVCVDNFMHGSEIHLQSVMDRIKLTHADVRNSAVIRSLLRRWGIEYIVNCTGDTFVPDSYDAAQRFLDTNASATLALLTVARDHSVTRMVHLSTTEVYGSRIEERIDEVAPLDPKNTYAVTKLAADRLCYTAYLEHGTPVVIARLFNTYGPRETHPYLVPEIISQLIRNGPKIGLGNLAAQRDLTYVDDTARAIICLLDPEIPNGEVFNVGSDNAYSVLDLVSMLGSMLGMSDIVIQCDERRLRRHDIDRFRCNNLKLRTLTSWQPTIGIEEGLGRTLAWYRRHPGGWSWESRSVPRGLAKIHE